MYVLCSLLAVKIGRPGYRVTKQFDAETKQRSLLFQVYFSSWSWQFHVFAHVDVLAVSESWY